MTEKEKPKEVNLPARIGDLVELSADGHDSIADGTQGVIMPNNNFYKLETKGGVEILNPGGTIDTQRIGRILEHWDRERIQKALSGSWALSHAPEEVKQELFEGLRKAIEEEARPAAEPTPQEHTPLE